MACCAHRLLFLTIFLLALRHAAPAAEWRPAAVPGFSPPALGEHPRLLFRKADLAKIRTRAQTPEGKAMIERMRVAMGGGEAMPELYQPGKTPLLSNPVGTFTLWHAACYGMLFHLTGDRKYAQLGRACFEKMWAGQRDRDDRYSWVDPSGALRAGPSIGAFALGYDLCYDGWDSDFRRTVARKLLEFQGGKYCSLKELAHGARHGPHSNHWGGQIGGASLALLAIRGDEGADAARVEPLLEAAYRNMIRQLSEGQGETGAFIEGIGPGQITSDTGFTTALQAWHVAGGKDFYANTGGHRGAKALALRWAQWMYPYQDRPFFFWFAPPSGGGEGGGGYGSDEFTRGWQATKGPSHSGQFAQGFFGLASAEQAALLWVYRNWVEPAEQAIYGQTCKLGGKPSYDALEYPHRALIALANWPIGVQPANPDGILPKCSVESQLGTYFFRKGWEDGDDIMAGGAFGMRDSANWQQPIIQGLGMRGLTLGGWKVGKAGPPEARALYADGSGAIRYQGSSFCADYHSAATGADAVFLMVGPAAGPAAGSLDARKAQGVTLAVGGAIWHVLILSASGAPFPPTVADGGKLVVGRQTYALADGLIRMSATAAPLE